MYGSDAGKPVQSLYTKGLSPLCDRMLQSLGVFFICAHISSLSFSMHVLYNRSTGMHGYVSVT